MCAKAENPKNWSIDNVETTSDYIVPYAGLALVARILTNSQFAEIFQKARSILLQSRRSKPQFSDDEIAEVYALMIANGSTIYDSIGNFNHQSEFIASALHLGRDHLPSAEILRQRLDALAEYKDIVPALYEASLMMLRTNGVPITPIPEGDIPCDFDVAIMDNSKTKKQGVEHTYKNCDGLAPMFSYLGLEGYCLEAELRAGSQHSQKGTLEMLKRCLEKARHLTTQPLLVRMDSGNDARENISYMMSLQNMGDDIKFIIKRNLRKESKTWWYNYAAEHSQNVQEPREGKKIYIGSHFLPVPIHYPDGYTQEQPIRVVYEVVARFINAKTGQMSIPPMLEVNTYWTSTDYSDERVIELYHEHATMEQFHSEIKSDMDVERLPSSKFSTNVLVLAIALFVYNIERMIGQASLDKDDVPIKNNVSRRRIRTVLLNIIHLPGKLVFHANKIILKISDRCAWHDTFCRLMERFAHADAFQRPCMIMP